MVERRKKDKMGISSFSEVEEELKKHDERISKLETSKEEPEGEQAKE